MADRQPTSSVGYMDLTWSDSFGVIVDELLERIPDLIWPLSIQTFSRMRNEPQIAGILMAFWLAIKRAGWAVDPAGCRDEVAAQLADDLGLPIAGVDPEPKGARRRAFTWKQHLRLALLKQVYGHMFFEQSWLEQGAMWRLAQVQERMPQTIAEVQLNPDGTLRWIKQEPRVGGPQPTILTANHALVAYVNDREGSNYFGRSMLRPSYPLWLIKEQVLRVHATSIRRFGMGVPSVEPLPGTSPTPGQLAEAQRVASKIKAGENSAVTPPPGFTYKLTGLTGNVPDALAFINYLDRSMSRSTLMELIDMPTAERGSRSLGETVMDMMIYAQQAVADDIADEATAQIVVPLVDANWGEDEPAPRVVCGDVSAGGELTADDINKLFQWGALIGDPNVWEWIRARYRIPDIDPAYLPGPQPAPDPAAGNA